MFALADVADRVRNFDSSGLMGLDLLKDPIFKSDWSKFKVWLTMVNIARSTVS